MQEQVKQAIKAAMMARMLTSYKLCAYSRLLLLMGLCLERITSDRYKIRSMTDEECLKVVKKLVQQHQRRYQYSSLEIWHEAGETIIRSL